MIRAYLVVGIAGLLALSGVAFWLVDTGYRRGKADCQMEALRIRTEIEAQWIRDADTSALAIKERSDAVAAIDETDAGDAVCLDARSVQRLGKIR